MLTAQSRPNSLIGFDEDQLASLSRALARVTLAAPATVSETISETKTVTPKPVDALELAPHALPASAPSSVPPREALVEPLLRALAEKNPLRVDVVARAPKLVLNVSGRAACEDDLDELLQTQVVPLVFGDSASIRGDDTRLVLDLRALAGCPARAAEAIIMRWATFTAVRCYHGGCVAVVMPRDPACAAALREAAQAADLARAFTDVRSTVLERARDVAAFVGH